MPYVGRSLNTGEFKVITLSESFDGSRVDFTMSESVGNVNQLIVILSGVVQHWTDAFTVSNTTLTFSSAPASGETIKILKLGDTNDIGVPSDSSVTADKLASTLNLSSKTLTLPAASVTAHVTSYDDNKLQSNIALLGFKTAVNGSLAKYNLQDQIIDEFTDATGIDASASTGDMLETGGYLGATPVTPTISHDADSTGVDGDYTWYKWTGTGAGTFSTNTAQSDIDFLVVAGGGAGGDASDSSGYGRGGGGAGGLRTSYGSTSGGGASAESKISFSASTTYTMTVGAGGAVDLDNRGGAGGDSSISGSGLTTITSIGGGGGGGYSADPTGGDGGSGGGAGYNTASGGAAGDGTASQGYAGGTSDNSTGAGGGGASAVGGNNSTYDGGKGGDGLSVSITGSAVTYAGGGGAGGNTNTGTAGDGGAGGGGHGAIYTPSTAAVAGTANTGGGGGGSLWAAATHTSAAGGSGVVIIRRKTTVDAAGADLVLQSNDTTAMSVPTTADMVMLMENQAGTATLNTDIKGWISRDSGANFTQGTLVDEGTWGTNKKILAFHDLDISGQPSGTSMCYKITTHNQSASSKETKIHATSIGWK